MKNLVIILASALFISACSSTTTPVDSARIAWAVGNCAPAETGYASILKTTDGGATWSRQGVGQASLLGIDLADVKAIDAQHVWAVGTKSTIVHTTDGGATWMAVATPLTSQVGLQSIDIVNGTHIYVTGEEGTVLRSTNAGATWSMCDTTGFNGAMIQGVHAISGDRVMICGGITVENDLALGFNRTTTNGGASWESVEFPNNFNRHELIGAYHYGTTLVFYGTTNYYVVSRDNGITWRADSTAVAGGTNGGADINHLIMLSENTWWASMDMGHILRTENAGTTWSDYAENLRGTFMLGIDAFDSNNAISVGETVGFPRTGPIARTTDGGATWTKVFSHDNALFHVSCVR
jgi:photosystem II stability/assembly factor-like uncharacterized protein